MSARPARPSRRAVLAATAGLAGTLCLPRGARAGMSEPPVLRAAVAEGSLPQMAGRLPRNPKRVDFAAEDKTLGRYGGTLTTLLGKVKDVRMLTVYEYSRLIGFNRDFALEVDILEDFIAEDDRIFTLVLREGHRWSDGHPFTAEDFRYWWEDVATVDALNEGAIDPAMMPDGHRPRFAVIDARTVRYAWPVPNPVFPLALAGSSPLHIYLPAHYMKRFHADYAEPEALARRVAEENVSDWSALHTRMGRMYRQENPDLPVLEAWQNTTRDASQRAVFRRNPYYHRVDPEGRQLPYIDEIVVNFGSTDIIPAKAGAGESDLQGRYIYFDNYTFLKQAEKSHDFTVRLWRNGVSSQIALYPNLNVKDPVWNALMNDARFRRALSIGLDRHELNQQLYFGLAREGGNTVLPASPLHDEALERMWTAHDPAGANALLDAIGLDRRDDDGVRLLPDGRRMEMVVETTGESTEETDALELVRYHWSEIGIAIFSKPLQRELLRRRTLAGDTLISISKGLDIGLATADMNPEQLAPVSVAQPNWPLWGQFTETRGQAGEPPPPGPAADLLALYQDWRRTRTTEERRAVWEEMLAIYADQVLSIGIAGETIQPIVVDRRLRNVPDEGIWAWQPTAYFGVYRPDTFYFADESAG